MKRIFMAIAAVVLLTSCLGGGSEYTEPSVIGKFMDCIVAADGSKIKLEYDSNNRVTQIVCTGETFGNKVYDIAYNYSAVTASASFDVTSNGETWRMYFNDLNCIYSWSSVDHDGTETILSTFGYTTANGVAYLANTLDRKTNAQSNIEWSAYFPAGVRNVKDSEVETAVYEYEVAVSNVHTNFNLFAFLQPEFLAVSGIDNVVAASVSVFGMRSYYLPTRTTVSHTSLGGSPEADKDAVVRKYSYDTDLDGCVQKIYEGSGDDKKLLYTISYFVASQNTPQKE